MMNHPETEYDSYQVHVRGANGIKTLGWHQGSPQALFEEVAEEEIDDDLGDFIEALFRRDGLKDIWYRADGTWSEGDLYVKPDPNASINKLMADLAKLRGAE